jgi:serine/threonine-protein kinase RsbW
MADLIWSWSLHENIPNTRDAGHQAIERLMAALEANGWEGRDLFHVQLAVEEAMINAITHGNKLAEDKVVEVEFKVHPATAFIRIKDQGEGFRPEDLPDPREDELLECTNGRGVMLIREMMSEIKYNELGNQITMVKNREPQTISDDQ